MSLLRPIHGYHSRADLIWPVGPIKVNCFLSFIDRKGDTVTRWSTYSYISIQIISIKSLACVEGCAVCSSDS